MPPLAFTTARSHDTDPSLALFLSFCVLLVGVNVAVFVVLGLGLCVAVRGAAQETRVELQVNREEEERLQAELAAMRALLEPQSAAHAAEAARMAPIMALPQGSSKYESGSRPRTS